MAPFVWVPPYENKAFLTNSVILRPNGKLFDHEKWFFTYLNIHLGIYHFHSLIFTVIRICSGCKRMAGIAMDLTIMVNPPPGERTIGDKKKLQMM